MLLAFGLIYGVNDTTASNLDYSNDVKEAVAIADADSGVCAEVDSDGYLKVNVVGGITVGDITTNTTITDITPGTEATDLGKAEDAAHASSDTGVLMLAVENDTLADLAADGDYVGLQVGGDGALFVKGDQPEDTAATSGDYGMPILAIRNDTIAALAGTDGDWANLQVDATGYLATADVSTQAEDAASSGAETGMYVLAVKDDALADVSADGDFSSLTVGAEGALYVMGDQAEDAAFTSGDYGLPILAVKDDALADVCADGDFASLTVGAEGALYVSGNQAEDAAHASADYLLPIAVVRNDVLAALAGADGDYSVLQVDAAGALYTTIQGTDAADIGKAEDAAHASSDTGIAPLAVRNDALAALGGADGDYSPIQVGAEGAVFVMGDQIEDTAAGDGDYALPILATRNDTLAALAGTDGDYGTLQIDAEGALFVTVDDLEKAEDAQHSSGDEGVMMLGVRNDVLAALGGTDGDFVPLQMDDEGALISVPKPVTAKAMTDDGQVSAAAAILYGVVITYDGVTSGDVVTIENSAADGGTALLSFVLGPTDGQITFNPPVGMKFDTGIWYDPAENGTTYCTFVYEAE